MECILKSSNLKLLFTSRTRLKILLYIAFQSHSIDSVRKLARLTDEDYRNVTRELKNLCDIGVISKVEQNNAIYYQRNPIHLGSLLSDLWLLLLREEVICESLQRIVNAMAGEAIYVKPDESGVELILFSDTPADVSIIQEMSANVGLNIRVSTINAEENKSELERFITESRTVPTVRIAGKELFEFTCAGAFQMVSSPLATKHGSPRASSLDMSED